MPKAWKLQAARQSSRIQGQDNVERPGGLNAALKKINQLTQAIPEPVR